MARQDGVVKNCEELYLEACSSSDVNIVITQRSFSGPICSSSESAHLVMSSLSSHNGPFKGHPITYESTSLILCCCPVFKPQTCCPVFKPQTCCPVLSCVQIPKSKYKLYYEMVPKLHSYSKKWLCVLVIIKAHEKVNKL